MDFIITPTYKDLFQEEKPDLIELLKDIPSQAVIAWLSTINSKLFISKGPQTQFEIFHTITTRLPDKTKNDLLKKIVEIELKNPDQEVQFFSYLGTLEFIHHELIHYRDFSIEDSTPEQELKVLKAYFVIVQNINDQYESVFGESLDKGEFFQTATWPIFLEQIELNHTPNPINALIRALIFFNYFEKNSKYSQYLNHFLDYHNRKHYWGYCLFLMDLLRINWENEPNDKRFGHFAIRSNKDVDAIFKNYSLNIHAYQQEYGENKKNFTGLKESPLIQFNEDQYLILNWNFIINKVYEGLVFDFYNHSGLKNSSIFKTFPDFKNFIAQEITEKYLFRKILSNFLNKEFSILNFDSSDREDGFPDAYYRDGKYIFLFEIKDAYFPSKAINSYNFQEICNAIDLKYNTKSKGTGQILKQLKRLSVKPFEEKEYKELKLKTRNLVIYPVLIYTDNFFSMPGINRYLNQKFKENIEYGDFKNPFQKINDLVFMNISFFINHIHQIENFDLKKCLDNYINKMHTSEKKFNQRHLEKDMLQMNQSFEQFVRSKYKIKTKNSKYIRDIFDIFEMREEFA